MNRENAWQGLLLGIGFFSFLGAFSCFAAEESITVTTYYPSPYGVYNEMRLYPKASATLPCQEGTMYYNSGNHTLMVCGGFPSDWLSLSSGRTFWSASPANPATDIYNTDLGRVGIGTSSPQRKVEINGGGNIHGAAIRFSGQPASTDSAIIELMNPAGTDGAWSIGSKGASNELFKIYSNTGAADRFILNVNDGTTILNPSGGNTQIGFISSPPAPARLSVSGNVSIGTPYITTAPPADGLIVNGSVGIGAANPTEKLEVSGNIKLSGASATYKVTNVANPTSAQDVATKAYVDAQASSGPGSWNCTVRSGVATWFNSNAICVSPEKVVSGGCQLFNNIAYSSYPTSQGWYCDTVSTPNQIRAYANCCK